MRKLLKKYIPGVAWQNPAVNVILKFIDPVDAAYSYLLGNRNIPKYSVRVRSNGFNGQFGGKRFAKNGRVLLELLKEHCDINPDSHILEIGCGCGRTAIAAVDYLDSGRFVGMDIEKVSLAACTSNRYLDREGFQFDFMDVSNDEFNPDGQYPADKYVFPYESDSFDTIFMVSVFTHMLTDDVKNYIKEMSRLVKSGGTVFITTFLMDDGRQTAGLSFPFKEKDHYYSVKEMPEIAVGFDNSFYIDEFAKYGLTAKSDAVKGAWRNPSDLDNIGDFSQDIVLFTKS